MSYIKRKIIYLGVLISQLNIFFLGRLLVKKDISSLDDITAVIFDNSKYKLSFMTLQFRFMSLFILFIFAYMCIFIRLYYELYGCRTMKLYRYGKDGYINMCIKNIVKADIQTGITVNIGMVIIILLTGLHNITMNINMIIRFELILLRNLLVMFIYGCVTVYLMLRKNSNTVIFIISLILFVQAVLEVFTNMKCMPVYINNDFVFKNMILSIVILLICSYLISFIIKKRFKGLSI